jgi:NADH-quinone oxidoreductase subunit B
VTAVDLPLPRAGRDTSAAAGSSATDTVVLDTGRGFALWVFDAGLACCAVECAAGLSRVSGEAAAGEAGDGEAAAAGAPDQGHANVFIVAGTVTDKLAPLVLRAYQRVPDPKWVLSFGACSNSGGPYWDSYCVTKGVDQLMPVDVYVPGCPPRPEALLHGLDVLAQQSPAGHLAGRP